MASITADREPRAVASAVTVLSSFERALRTHPVAVAVFTIASFSLVGTLQLWIGTSWALMINYALPIAICAYGVGLVAGAVAAFAADILLVVSAMQRGLVIDDFASLLMFRLISNLVIVVIAAGAAAAARARERYDTAQRQLVQTQADLVSAFSHDLRSPLGAIIGYAEILREDLGASATVDTAEALDAILASASQVDKLIGDMLTAGRGDRAAPLQLSAFDVHMLVADLRREFAAQPPREGVVLEWVVDPHGPAMQSDRSKVASIVRNLLSNALKFTRRGRVEVRIRYLPEADAHRFEVEDTGPGISSEALPHIFDRFYRVASTRQTAGFGLGLVIVKRFTELLGGSVTVESEAGRGTRFCIILPRLPIRAAVSPERASAALG